MLQVLSTKDEEASKLRGTVDALRSLLAEKDDVSLQRKQLACPQSLERSNQ